MPEISFRPVTRDDLPMLSEWLHDAQVAQWWPDAEDQLEGIAEDLNNPEMRQSIALMDGQPVGYAQYYSITAWPAPHLSDLPPDTLGVDVFGAPAARGYGGLWIRALSDLLLQKVTSLVIDPSPDNHRAIVAYEKAGFAGEIIRNDGEGHPARIMTRLR